MTKLNKYAHARAIGNCVICFKRKADEGYRSCLICRTRRSKRYYDARSKYVCVTCRKDFSEPGLTKCLRCHRRAMANQNRRKARYLSEGKCYSCGEPKQHDGKRKCRRCMDQHAMRRRLEQYDRKLHNMIGIDDFLCINCGGDLVDAGDVKHTDKSCGKCLFSRRLTARKRKLGNKCVICGVKKRKDKFSSCVRCRFRSRMNEYALYHKRKASGVCTKCGGDIMDTEFKKTNLRCGDCSEKQRILNRRSKQRSKT